MLFFRLTTLVNSLIMRSLTVNLLFTIFLWISLENMCLSALKQVEVKARCFPRESHSDLFLLCPQVLREMFKLDLMNPHWAVHWPWFKDFEAWWFLRTSMPWFYLIKSPCLLAHGQHTAASPFGSRVQASCHQCLLFSMELCVLFICHQIIVQTRVQGTCSVV